MLSRDENDPAGEVREKTVLATFVRVSPVLNVHVGGKLIGTTGEHPFYVDGKGWVEARSLRIGDLLVSRAGEKIPVEGIADSGRIELVYNFEVEDDHTYFVGKEAWGWDVWVHNANYANLNSNSAKSNFGLYEITINGRLHKIGKADLNRVTQSSKLPTRLHQQVRKLRELNPHSVVEGQVVDELGVVTTKDAKA